MINNNSRTLNNELQLYVILNAYSFMGMMLYIWFHLGKPSFRNHSQPSESLYSSEAVLPSPQLPPTECYSCMNIFDFASCVAHGSQASYEVDNPTCPCAASDTSRKNEDRHFVDAVSLRAQIPAHPQAWCNMSLTPSQQVSAF